MRRLITALLAMLLLCGIAIPAASAADLTTEQKFELLRQKGIFAGFSDGSPGLYQSMTREQFAQVLYKLLELPSPAGSASYSDVLRTRWSYVPVEAVTEAGLMVGTGPRKFSPDSPVTVEQLAAVLIRSYGWTGGDQVYVIGKVSPWARVSVAIALQNRLIPQMRDYTEIATRGLLVEAAYAVYEKTNGTALHVSSVTPIANQQLRVNLTQPVTAADKSRFRVRDVLGAELNVLGTAVGGDGRSVIVFTEPQTPGRAYSLYVDGVPWTYVALSDDNVKPVIQSFFRHQDAKLELVFSEPVDRGSATNRSHYVLNNGLRVNDVHLSDDNRKVTITTSSQRDGTSYRLTVKNVKDLAGNVMQEWSVNFLSDSSWPVATFRFNESTAVITVIFSEKVHPDAAVNLNRYSINNGLSITRADLDGDGKTVYLTTSPQSDATVYTLTVSGIPDLAGNVMKTQTFQFGGVAHPAQPVKLQSAKAVNDNTIEVTFDRALSNHDVSKMGVAILTDNGNSVSMSGWSTFKMMKSGSGDKIVTVQFRTKDNGNPDLFRPGRVYAVRITGIDHLVTADNANVQTFAGTEADNPVPFVKEVIPLSRSKVKVVMSEPVKNMSEAAFLVREKEGDAAKVLDIEGIDTNAVVTEAVLIFEKELESGHVYIMTFRSGTVTDAAGWNGFKTKNGNEDYMLEFRGV